MLSWLKAVKDHLAETDFPFLKFKKKKNGEEVAWEWPPSRDSSLRSGFPGAPLLAAPASAWTLPELRGPSCAAPPGHQVLENVAGAPSRSQGGRLCVP